MAAVLAGGEDDKLFAEGPDSEVRLLLKCCCPMGAVVLWSVCLQRAPIPRWVLAAWRPFEPPAAGSAPAVAPRHGGCSGRCCPLWVSALLWRLPPWGRRRFVEFGTNVVVADIAARWSAQRARGVCWPRRRGAWSSRPSQALYPALEYCARRRRALRRRSRARTTRTTSRLASAPPPRAARVSPSALLGAACPALALLSCPLPRHALAVACRRLLPQPARSWVPTWPPRRRRRVQRRQQPQRQRPRRQRRRLQRQPRRRRRQRTSFTTPRSACRRPPLPRRSRSCCSRSCCRPGWQPRTTARAPLPATPDAAPAPPVRSSVVTAVRRKRLNRQRRPLSARPR